jgi:hypothetical protein
MNHRCESRATLVALFFLCTSLGLHAVFAQEAVYRCGNDYTNDAARAKSEKCKLLESGAIVTVPSHKRALDVQTSASQSANRRFIGTPLTPATKEQKTAQQKRDSDSQLIIESELKKTESQLADLRQKWVQIPANASGAELERKAYLKQQMARHEADIVSLTRELKR